jgi:hypothetical protein
MAPDSGSRVAIDRPFLSLPKELDDIGTFDSLLLAKPYQALLALGGRSLRLNEQQVNGAVMSVPALRAGGVALVLTPHARDDLKPLGRRFDINIYGVNDPAPRACFYSLQAVTFLPEDQIMAALQREKYVKERLLMPLESQKTALVSRVSFGGDAGTVTYHRPSSDEILLDVSAGGPGFVNVVEAYDPGWQALVDGQLAPLYDSNCFTLAIPVTAGQHVIRLHYYTPGRSVGIALSLLSAALLALLIAFAGKWDRRSLNVARQSSESV